MPLRHRPCISITHDASSDSMQPVSKAAKLDDTGQLGLLGQILKIEHLDIEPDVNFEWMKLTR